MAHDALAQHVDAVFIVIAVVFLLLIGEVGEVVGRVHVTMKAFLMVWIRVLRVCLGGIGILEVFLQDSEARERRSMCQSSPRRVERWLVLFARDRWLPFRLRRFVCLYLWKSVCAWRLAGTERVRLALEKVVPCGIKTWAG